jgi:hypothetical protein
VVVVEKSGNTEADAGRQVARPFRAALRAHLVRQFADDPDQLVERRRTARTAQVGDEDLSVRGDQSGFHGRAAYVEAEDHRVLRGHRSRRSGHRVVERGRRNGRSEAPTISGRGCGA